MNPYQEDYYEPVTVTRKPTEVNHFTSGVVIPGAQAIITGVLCGIAALAITAWFNLPFWAIGGTAAAVIMAGSWLAYRSRWQIVLENLLGVDLNHDGRIGTQPLPQALPAPQAEQVRIELVQDQGRRGDFIDLPYADRLPQLAAGLTNGRQFAQAAWCGQSGIFSRSEFDALRDTMIERGLMAWKNPEAKAQGVVLTAAGRSVMKRLAGSTPPLLQDRK